MNFIASFNKIKLVTSGTYRIRARAAYGAQWECIDKPNIRAQWECIDKPNVHLIIILCFIVNQFSGNTTLKNWDNMCNL
jgi:hypothetical protein